MLGFPVLRLRGDYLAIVTLAFGEIIRLVILNWQSLTGGLNDVSGTPRPTFFGTLLTADDDGLAAKLSASNSRRRIASSFVLSHSRARASDQRGDDPASPLADRSGLGSFARGRSGLPRARHQYDDEELTAFATGSMFGGFASAFVATRQGFISPKSFTFQESALVLAIVVFGGMGSQLGVALAVVTLIGGFELFRGFDQYRMLVFGKAMVRLMICRPRGLIGHRAPTVYLKRSQAISSDLVKEGHGR